MFKAVIIIGDNNKSNKNCIVNGMVNILDVIK
jgi:hypothetical protein